MTRGSTGLEDRVGLDARHAACPKAAVATLTSQSLSNSPWLQSVSDLAACAFSRVSKIVKA